MSGFTVVDHLGQLIVSTSFVSIQQQWWCFDGQRRTCGHWAISLGPPDAMCARWPRRGKRVEHRLYTQRLFGSSETGRPHSNQSSASIDQQNRPIKSQCIKYNDETHYGKYMHLKRLDASYCSIANEQRSGTSSNCEYRYILDVDGARQINLKILLYIPIKPVRKRWTWSFTVRHLIDWHEEAWSNHQYR